MRAVSVALAAAFSVGCFTPPPQAPTELDDLTRFLFREWAHEEPEVLQDGMVKLEKFLETVDFSEELYYRSFQLDSCTTEDLATINAPEGQDPAKTVGMGVVFESRWPVGDHARLQMSGDLLDAEPSAKSYVRRFVDPSDGTCFVDRSCDSIFTDNDITRSSFIMSVDMMLHKNFKWVELPEGRHAIVSRSWTPRVFTAEDPDDAILQSYTLDIWLERPDGKTWRYQALYQESKFGIDVEPGTIVATVTDSTDGMFRDTDEVIGERFHGE